MVVLTPFGIEGGGAADRVDALVWPLTGLFPRVVKPRADVSWEDERGGCFDGPALDQAYFSARLITRPDKDWLNP
jgi:hypothetical protein